MSISPSDQAFLVFVAIIAISYLIVLIIRSIVRLRLAGREDHAVYDLRNFMEYLDERGAVVSGFDIDKLVSEYVLDEQT